MQKEDEKKKNKDKEEKRGEWSFWESIIIGHRFTNACLTNKFQLR